MSPQPPLAVPGDALPLPAQLRERDRARLVRYRQHLAFYQGEQWAERLRSDPRRRPRQLTVNYVRAFVDKGVSYLLAEQGVAVDPIDASPAAEARAAASELALAVIRDVNQLDQLDFDTELDTAVLGDGCYKVWWQPGNDGEPGRVRVTAPDVQGLFAWWAPEDLTTLRRVAQRYPVPADEAARLAPGLSLPAGAADVEVIEDWTAGHFSLWVGGRRAEARPNPYGFIPYIIFPNLRDPKTAWGVSDLAPLVEPARELNRALSTLGQILELSGNPIAVIENVEKAEDIAVAPGAVWELPERAKAYLLDLLSGGGVRLHIEYIDLLYRTLHDLGETPRTAFGDNRGRLSGVALEMELQPLLQKVKRKRLIRGWVYRRRNELMLRLLDRFAGGDHAPYQTRVLWGPVLPQDRSRLIDDEVRLVAAGLHARATAMDALGIDNPGLELSRITAEAATRPAG